MLGQDIFLPLDNEPQIELWLRADLGLTLSGLSVTQWNDQSGIGDPNRNMITGGYNPTWNAVDPAYNNQSTITLSSAPTRFYSAANYAVPVPPPWTVFFVGNDDGTTTSEIIFGELSGSVYYCTGSETHYSVNGVFSSTKVRSSNPSIFVVEVNGTSSTLAISENVPEASGAIGGTFSLTQPMIGYSSPLIGKVAEVRVYSGLLSQAQKDNVMNYLGTRYGITIGA